VKKFLVPVSWSVSTWVEVEAEDIDEAAHEASGVDLDLMPDPEYVGDSFEIHYEDIQEVEAGKFDENVKGDFSEWDKMPGGF